MLLTCPADQRLPSLSSPPLGLRLCPSSVRKPHWCVCGSLSGQSPSFILNVLLTLSSLDVSWPPLLLRYVRTRHFSLQLRTLRNLPSPLCLTLNRRQSVTSPIGLWTAARKPIVSNLGSAILKISGACREKKNTDSNYMGMRRCHWRSGEVAMVARAGSRGHWSINLSITTQPRPNAYPALSSNIKSGRPKFHKWTSYYIEVGFKLAIETINTFWKRLLRLEIKWEVGEFSIDLYRDGRPLVAFW